MNKQEIYKILRKRKMYHELVEHGPIFTMSELDNTIFPYPECIGKNLFVRDDKKRNYYLIIVKGDKKINLKEFKEKYNTRSLSFASDNDLMDILLLIPGSVTPFGLLNDEKKMVKFFIDKEFFDGEGMIGIHPNENNAMVFMKVEDLISLIKEHGNEVVVME